MKKNDNILQFPKEVASRARIRQRKTNRQAGLGLSILSVLIFSVVVNQWVTQSRTDEAGRGIASVNRSGESRSSVKWEHELAKELSQSKDVTARYGEKPSLRDELVFGSLEGRYGVEIKEGRVAALEFSNSASQLPVVIADRGAFLKRYQSALLVNEFSDVEVVKSVEGSESWNLKKGSTIVGHAEFAIDGDGRVVSLRIDR